MSYTIGETASRTRTITDEDIRLFAQASGDTNSVHLDEDFCHAGHCCQITARAELMVLRADQSFRQGRHFKRRLRICEAFKPALTQWIESDDGRATLAHLLQLVKHARTIDADILAEEEDAVRCVKILEPHGAYRHAYRFGQRYGRTLVAHVRTIGQVVVAEHAGKQLVHVRGFERSTA